MSCRSEGVVKRKKDRGCKEGRAQRRHRGRNSGRCGKRQRLMSARAYCFLLQSQTSMAIDSVKNSSQTNHICSQIYTKHVCGTYALFPFEIRIGPWHVGGLSGSLWDLLRSSLCDSCPLHTSVACNQYVERAWLELFRCSFLRECSQEVSSLCCLPCKPGLCLSVYEIGWQECLQFRCACFGEPNIAWRGWPRHLHLLECSPGSLRI